MTIPQVNVKNEFDIARPGMSVDSAGMQRVESYVADEEIGFGLAVVRGAADDSVKLPTDATDITDKGALQGAALSTHFLESLPQGGVTPESYKATDMVNTAKQGAVWVVAEDNPQEGDNVFIRFSASGNERLGAFRTDADTADAAAAPSGMQWAPGGDSTLGLAPLLINLP